MRLWNGTVLDYRTLNQDHSLQEPFNSGSGVYIADIFDCIPATQSMANVKTAMEGVYDIHENTDGICCPNRGL